MQTSEPWLLRWFRSGACPAASAAGNRSGGTPRLPTNPRATLQSERRHSSVNCWCCLPPLGKSQYLGTSFPATLMPRYSWLNSVDALSLLILLLKAPNDDCHNLYDTRTILIANAYVRHVEREGDQGSGARLTVLSTSPVMRRDPDTSNAMQLMPASLSSDPGCTIVCSAWKRLPLW